MFSNPHIIQFFLTELPITDGIEDTLAGKFAALLERVWSGKYLVLHPKDFKNLLSIYHPQFNDFRQVDMNEQYATQLLCTVGRFFFISIEGCSMFNFYEVYRRRGVYFIAVSAKALKVHLEIE